MNEMSDIKDDIRKEQFQNVSKKIPEKGIYLTVHKEYPAYSNLTHYNVMWNGKFTGKRFISYKDTFVANTGISYELLPNEYIQEMVNNMMYDHEDWRMSPDVKPTNHSWGIQDGNVIMNKGGSYAPSGTSQLFKYQFPETIDPTGDGRKLRMGICIGNSIDLTRGFSVFPYHHRDGCDNSMYHVRAQKLLEEGTIQWENTGLTLNGDREYEITRKNTNKAISDLETFKVETKKVQRSLRHSKNLTPEVVEDIIMNSMAMVENLAKRYQEMAQLKANKLGMIEIQKELSGVELHAVKLANSSLPNGILDNLDGLKRIPLYKEVDGKRIEENGIEAYNVELTRFTDKREVGGDGNERSMTSWDLYNNITNKLSHDNRGLTFNSALKHYGELDRVFAV